MNSIGIFAFVHSEIFPFQHLVMQKIVLKIISAVFILYAV